MSTEGRTDVEVIRRVSFLVVREGPTAEGLFEAIGIEPDDARSRSDRTPVEASWLLRAEGGADDDLETLVESVLMRVRAAEDQLAEVCADRDTTCLLRIMQYVGNDAVGPGFVLDAADIALLAEMQAFLDVDQYWVSSENDIDEPAVSTDHAPGGPAHETVLFPGLPDHDPVDRAVAQWAADTPAIRAAVRAWSQPGHDEDGDTRTRVYGLLVHTDDQVAAVRAAWADLAAAAGSADPVNVEIAVPTDNLAGHLERLFGIGVVLWEAPR